MLTSGTAPPVHGAPPDLPESPLQAASLQSDASIASTDHDIDDGKGPFLPAKSKKRRRPSKTSSTSGDTVVYAISQHPGLTVIVKPKDPSKLMKKLNPLKLNDHLDSIAPDGVIAIRPNYRLNLLALDTRNSESTKALLTLTSIGGIAVQVYAPHPRDAAVGIIQDVTKDISDDQLNCSLRGTAPILHARRFGATSTVKVVFATPSAPAYVTLGYTRFKVHPFLSKPLQCNRCYHFGHISSGCDKAISCPRCCGAHDRSDCTSEVLRCSNCSKSHDSVSPQCKVYKTEQAILQYSREHKVDYTTAKSAMSKAPGPRVRRHGDNPPELTPTAMSEDFNNVYPTLPSTEAPLASVTAPAKDAKQTARPTGSRKTPGNDSNTAKNQGPVMSSEAYTFGPFIWQLLQKLREFLVPQSSLVAQFVIMVLDFRTPIAAVFSR